MNTNQLFESMMRGRSEDWVLHAFADAQLPPDLSEETPVGQALVPDESYLTIRLRSLRLVQVRELARPCSGVVYSNARVKSMSGGAAAVQTVFTPGDLRQLEGNVDRELTLNRTLLGPVPYRGGAVRLQVGLFSIELLDMTEPFLQVLEQMSNSAGVSFVEPVTPFEGPISEAFRLLTETQAGNAIELALSKEIRQDELATGWYVLVRASSDELDPESFSLNPTTHYLRDGVGDALSNHPYLVFSIDKSAVRMDWARIDTIDRAWNDIDSLLRDNDDTEVANAFQQFRRLTLTSPNLLSLDAERLCEKARTRIASLAVGTETSAGATVRSLPKLAELDLYESRSAPAGGNESRLYTVWFGTNRAPKNPHDLRLGFSRRRDRRTHYGHCKVVIPKSHRFGSTGTSWWRRWARLEFSDDNIRVRERVYQEEAEFWSAVSTTMAERPAEERQALVFLHGYNTSFDEAAIRAAQIGFDLRCLGLTAFYSWPSSGETGGYTSDEAAISGSEALITDFLVRFATDCGADRVDLIAHSMGNRGLLRAIQRIATNATLSSRVKFGQVFLAAPDVDVGLFEDLAQHFPPLTKRTTIYASPTDHAVELSEWIHDSPRVGLTPPVTIVEGIDTIEVRQFNLLSLGHSYFAESEALLSDMFDLTRRDASPEDRQRPVRHEDPNGRVHWAIP